MPFLRSFHSRSLCRKNPMAIPTRRAVTANISVLALKPMRDVVSWPREISLIAGRCRFVFFLLGKSCSFPDRTHILWRPQRAHQERWAERFPGRALSLFSEPVVHR